MGEVVISVRGGTVEAAYASDGVRVRIVDWETTPRSDPDNGRYVIEDGAGRPRGAYVEEIVPARISRLRGSDLERALAARERQFGRPRRSGARTPARTTARGGRTR